MKSFIESKYKLKANPFSSRVDLTAPMAGRKKERESWQKIIRQTLGQAGNSLNFVVGDYGLGKSFTLHKILEDSREHKEVLPVGLKFLPEDTVRKFGLEFVQRLFRQVDLPGILDQAGKRSLSRLKNGFLDPALVFRKVLSGDELALAFLRGERSLDKKEFKDLEVRRRIDSTEVAKEYLLAFLYVLRQSGKKTMVLTLDEVEYVFSQMRGAKIALVFNTLRDLYDLPQSPDAIDMGKRVSNMIFFFAISEDGFRRLNDLQKRERSQGGPIQAFMDRKDRVITLQVLSKAEANQLIELRLRFNRVTRGYDGKALIPYTRDFVAYIYARSKGHPRDIIARCDIVLRDGLEERVSLLTKHFARKVFESHGMTVGRG